MPGHKGQSWKEHADSLQYGDFPSLRDFVRALGAAVDQLEAALAQVLGKTAAQAEPSEPEHKPEDAQE